MPLTDCIDELLFSTIAETTQRNPTEIECEVIELFEQYSERLLRYSLSFGIPLHDAEEIVQETFLSLFRHLELGKPRTNLRGWIFRVAHNLALKQRVANKKVCDAMEFGESIVKRQYDPSPNPEESLSSRQRQCHLMAVVNALPLADQNCLRLRADGLRYREIASVLGISLGTVSLSLTRSLARLIRADGR
jgi:RNA polymerase sigma-70 factor (ECF subfamily)